MEKLKLIKKRILNFSKQIYAALVFMFFLTGCYEFDFINQPGIGEVNSYFDVEISVNMGGNGDYTNALFGVLKPIGWTIADTLFYQATSTGDTSILIYSESQVGNMNYIDPPPVGYEWWVGIEENAFWSEYNYYMELRIFTDNQTGSFSLDYMLGDTQYEGINSKRSNNHAITIDAPESLTVSNTNDHGPGSFRQAIDSVSFYGSIDFDIDPSDTLVLESELNINKDLIITGPEESNLVISGNDTLRVLNIEEQNVSLLNMTLINGYALNGGGINAQGSTIELSNMIIKNNIALESGGGIYGGNISFDSIHKNSIYDNFAPTENDLNITSPGVIHLDTFSVQNPTSFHTNSGLFFEIEHGLHEQTFEDLYVSPFGSNLNSGLSSDEPLQTINLAFSMSLATEDYEQIIFLDSGEYKISNKRAIYPLFLPDYVSLTGLSRNLTILDAEELSTVIKANNNDHASLNNMTITGGRSFEETDDNYGGGIQCHESYLSMQEVNIIANSARYGGGMSIQSSSVHFYDCLFENNFGFDGGGAILCRDSTSNITIRNSQIVNNHTAGTLAYGGGMFVEDGFYFLENVIISGNSSEDGGGIYCAGANLTLNNTTIISNSSISSSGNGGGIYFVGSESCIINSTIANNMSENNFTGGGIYSRGTDHSIINSIIWNNYPYEIYCVYSPPGEPANINISYSDLLGAENGIGGNGYVIVNWLEGNIDADPLFTGSGEYPFSLSNESPSLNAGTPDTTGLNLPVFDLAGNPRLYGGRIDMGAYENQEVVGSVDDLEKVNEGLNIKLHPNPVRSIVSFEYSLSKHACVILKITNQKGWPIETLLEGVQEPGRHMLKWDAEHLMPGLYFCCLKADGIETTRKFIKVK